jgi:hypothetical protein
MPDYFTITLTTGTPGTCFGLLRGACIVEGSIESIFSVDTLPSAWYNFTTDDLLTHTTSASTSLSDNVSIGKGFPNFLDVDKYFE